jgi:dTDP-4-dehydrorhamnose 3,5-epimerase-like enzyme
MPFRPGSLEGLWKKLVYVPHGEAFTAVADIRRILLRSVESKRSAWAAETGTHVTYRGGVAHSHCTLSDSAKCSYQVTEYYGGSDTRP